MAAINDDYQHDVEDFSKQLTDQNTEISIVRNFKAKYAIIYANEDYSKLRKIEKFAKDLK